MPISDWMNEPAWSAVVWALKKAYRFPATTSTTEQKLWPSDCQVDRGSVVVTGPVDGLALRIETGGNRLTSVASARALRLDGADEASEIASRAVAVEDCLVTNNNELDDIPLSPCKDVGELSLSAGDAGVGDEDTEDKLETIVFAGIANVLQCVAVGAIDPDGGEAFCSNVGNIGSNGTLVSAATR